MTRLLTSRRSLLAGAAAFALPAVAFAAEDPKRALAEGWVAAVNDPSRRAAWVESAFSDAGLRATPPAERMRLLAGAAESSGGVDLLDLRTDGTDVFAVVRARRGGLRRAVRLSPARNQPDKLFAAGEAPHPIPPAKPTDARPMARAEFRDVIRARIDHALANDEFSGVVRVVAPDGSVVHQSVHGWADRDQGVRVDADHRFHLGSADKSFTALLIARYVTAGRLTLDAPVAKVLPDYANKGAAAKITVRHLLTHTSGLGDLWSRPGWDDRRRFDRVSQIVPLFSGADPAFEPGARAAYSNEGYVLLGAIVEAVGGASWWDQLADQVYRPAGMTGAAHYTLDGPAPKRAVGYMYREGDALGLGGRTDNWSVTQWRGNSCGGGYATAEDMTNYLRALRAGRLCTPEQAALFTAQATPGLRNYGMGFERHVYGARTVVGHSGGGPFHGVNVDDGVVWETGWAFAVLGNYDAPFAQFLAADIGRLVAAQSA